MKTLNADNAANVEPTMLPRLIDNAYAVDDETLAQFAIATAATGDVLQMFRQAYLRVLLAGVQKELGQSSPTKRSVKTYKQLNDGDRIAQLRTLNEKHTRYYSIILGAITTPDIADTPRLSDVERRRRSLERNRRSNYARTAKSVLTQCAALGYDLTEINVLTVTKAQVAKLVAQRKMPETTEEIVAETPARLKGMLKRIVANAKTLAETDAEGATALIQAAMSQLGDALLDMGMKPTAKLEIGVREHRPVRLKEGVFWPIESGAIRSTHSAPVTLM